jgi:hypothetical protein
MRQATPAAQETVRVPAQQFAYRFLTPAGFIPAPLLIVVVV